MAKGKNYTEEKYLTMQSSVRTIAFKFYEEQVTTGSFKDIIEDIHGIDPNEYEVIGIIHNRDTNKDDFWDPSIEKPHMHVIIRITCKPFKKMTPVKVRTMLNLLPHLQYRLTKKDKETGEIIEEGLDDKLWKKHGAETVWDFAEYAVYLTHDTEKAIADGKAHYDVEEYVSNLSLEIIKQIRDGYQLYSNDQSRPDYETMAKLDEAAYKLGYDLGDYDEWYGSLSYGIRKNAGFKTIKESFYRGTQARLKEHEEIPRLCVYIKGGHATGKTKTCLTIMHNYGIEVLDASGQGSGRYDRLTPHTDAIVLSDDITANLLNISDQYMCNVYKRGSNNPIWAGHYLLVTQNVSFDDWVERCGYKDPAQIAALKSRFFICHIEKHCLSDRNVLICDSIMSRNSQNEAALFEKFREFQDMYNKICREYFEQQHNKKEIDKSVNIEKPHIKDLFDALQKEKEMDETLAKEEAKAHAFIKQQIGFQKVEIEFQKAEEAKRAEAQKAEAKANMQKRVERSEFSHKKNLEAIKKYEESLESKGLSRLAEEFSNASKKSVFQAAKVMKKQLDSRVVKDLLEITTPSLDLENEVFYEALVKKVPFDKLRPRINTLCSYVQRYVKDELASYGLCTAEEDCVDKTNEAEAIPDEAEVIPDEELPFL